MATQTVSQHSPVVQFPQQLPAKEPITQLPLSTEDAADIAAQLAHIETREEDEGDDTDWQDFLSYHAGVLR